MSTRPTVVGSPGPLTRPWRDPRWLLGRWEVRRNARGERRGVAIGGGRDRGRAALRRVSSVRRWRVRRHGEARPAPGWQRCCVPSIGAARLADAAGRWAMSATATSEVLVAHAVELAATSGHATPLLFDTVADGLRERAALGGEIRAQTSQARASALALGLLPLAFTGLLALTDPGVASFPRRERDRLGLPGRGAGARGGRGMVDAPHHRRSAPMIAVLLAVGWAAIVVAIGRAHRSVARCAHLVPSRRWALTKRRAGTARADRPARRGRCPGLDARRSGRFRHGARGHRPRPAGPVGRAARRAAAARAARLPDAIELLVVAGSAGLTARQGLRLVAERGPPELRPAFIDVIARTDAGVPLGEALPRVVDSVGEPARSMVRAILTAERDGVPIRSLLAHLADEARRQRRHELEAAVRRLPVRLTFPLACCSLPAFVVLTVVPLAAAGLQRLGSVPL